MISAWVNTNIIDKQSSVIVCVRVSVRVHPFSEQVPWWQQLMFRAA